MACTALLPSIGSIVHLYSLRVCRRVWVAVMPAFVLGIAVITAMLAMLHLINQIEDRVYELEQAWYKQQNQVNKMLMRIKAIEIGNASAQQCFVDDLEMVQKALAKLEQDHE